jgi:hypothetical protein
MKPLIVPIILNTAIFSIFLLVSMQMTDGHTHYALDDAYIHMAIAKNIVNNHIYGVTSHETTFASSSPIWTAILSSVYLFNQSEYIPLLLNLLLSYIIIFITYFISKEFGCKDDKASIISSAVVLLTPLAPLIFGGMDTTLHIVAYLLLILFFIKSEKTPKYNKWFYSSAIIAGGSRIETIFIIIPICIYLLYKKQTKKSILLLISSILIFGIHGIYTYSSGGFILPTSIMSKSAFIYNLKTHGIISAFETGFIANTLKTPILILAITSLIFLYKNENKNIYLIVLISILLHMQFSGTGWLYRYEAYIIASMIILTLSNIEKSKIITKVIIIFMICLLLRSVLAHISVLIGIQNVYDQQYQMGLFVKKYYNNSTVLLNDLGGISYHSNAKIIDIAGLSNIDFVKAKNAGIYNSSFTENYAKIHNADIAIVYNDYVYDIPKSWALITEWNTTTYQVTVGSNIVAFYALKPDEYDTLSKYMHEFEKTLPNDVKVTYY